MSQLQLQLLSGAMTLQALNFRRPRILLAVSTQSDADPTPACQWEGPTQDVAGAQLEYHANVSISVSCGPRRGNASKWMPAAMREMPVVEACDVNQGAEQWE